MEFADFRFPVHSVQSGGNFMPQVSQSQLIESTDFPQLLVSTERCGQLRFEWVCAQPPADFSRRPDLEDEEPERWDGLS
jgi:hypothetical protein